MCGRGVRTVIVEYTESLSSEQRVDISDSLEVELMLMGDLNHVRAGLGVDVALGTLGSRDVSSICTPTGLLVHKQYRNCLIKNTTQRAS